jgi:hypothetical protein
MRFADLTRRLGNAPRLASTLLVAALASSTAFAGDQGTSGTLNANSVYCLNPEVANYFAAFGYARDLYQNPVAVRWTVWHGPSPSQTNTQLVRFVDSSFSYNANGPGDYTQACIRNTSGVTVSFYIAQSAR